MKTPQSNDDNYRRLVAVMQDIGEERRKQDLQWGGPAMDDTRDCRQWLGYIDHQIDKANQDMFDMGGIEAPGYEAAMRARFVKIAALAVAAIQSVDRRKERTDAANT